jgi:isoleucyl-tRNA synthetase
VELPLNADHETLLDAAAWSEIAIVSSVTLVPDMDEPPARVTPASGDKCARCWRVLQEVGLSATHPSLCLRCTDAVESGLVCKPAA